VRPDGDRDLALLEKLIGDCFNSSGLSGRGVKAFLRKAPLAYFQGREFRATGRAMPPMSIQIDNARYVVTVDASGESFQDGSVLIEDGAVSRVGKAASLAERARDRVIDRRAS